MPSFLLHIETTNGTAEDQEGAWFPDILSAENEAAAAVRELVADSTKKGFEHRLPEAIVVTDQSGKRLLLSISRMRCCSLRAHPAKLAIRAVLQVTGRP
jgi:hypothetical protein